MNTGLSGLVQKFTSYAADPAKLRRYLYVHMRSVPFRLGLTSVSPGTYLAYAPDRYTDNYHLYVSKQGPLGSLARKKFLQGNRAANGGDLTRYFFLNLVKDQIEKENIKGDLAELGVYKGNTGFLLAEIARKLGRTAYLFDTYEGFASKDLTDIDADQRSQFMDTSLNSVRSLVGDENVEFIQGYFPDSLGQVRNDLSFCLVHIDCDLYAPFCSALEYFYPRLVPGGFLIMHDYSSLWWDGAEKAVDEFLADKPEKVTPIPDKSGTAVIRKM